MHLIFHTLFDHPAGDARHLRHECYTSQRTRSERNSNLTYIVRADHEFHCSSTAPINHKVYAENTVSCRTLFIYILMLLLLSLLLPKLWSVAPEKQIVCFVWTVHPSQIHLRHEESPSHIISSLDMSYGKHWDEINNKCTLQLSQSFKNQSTQNHTSYTLEVNREISLIVFHLYHLLFHYTKEACHSKPTHMYTNTFFTVAQAIINVK